MDMAGWAEAKRTRVGADVSSADVWQMRALAGVGGEYI